MMANSVMKNRDQWISARVALLEKEKAHARASDELAAERRKLGRYKLDRNYRFDGPNGQVSLADAFENRSQLVVQHFMFAEDWEAGCPFCSFWADGYDPMILHLNQRDISFVVVSRGPVEKLEAYKQRMNWSFTWLSSANCDFNFDFEVSPTAEQEASGQMIYNYREGPIRGSESHGVSVFEQDPDGSIFHTYSSYARGMDRLNAAYGYIDISPKGRQEEDLPYGMSWVRRHDEY